MDLKVEGLKSKHGLKIDIDRIQKYKFRHRMKIFY